MNTINITDNLEKITNKETAIPDRIKEARIYRGFTQQELANAIGLSKQSVCKYEIGKNKVPVDVLIKITNILNFPIRFFYKKKIATENIDGEVYFRSSAIPSKKKDMLIQKLNYLSAEITNFIELYIKLPVINLIDVEYKKEYSNQDIGNIVKQLRHHWGLSDKPIDNLTYTMQENGCVIARLFLDSEKTDGYSKWIGERPYTFLNTEKNAAVRARFTLAHELGHIVLHRNLKKGENIKKREKEANYFAGEFLFPNETVLDEIAFVTLDALLPLKAKWGISIGAIVRRCLDLELITEERYLLLQKQISKRKWRTFEPLDDTIKCEKPRLFNEAFNLLIDNGVLVKSDILNSILFSEDELVKICCLEPSFFKEKSISMKPKLKIVK